MPRSCNVLCLLLAGWLCLPASFAGAADLSLRETAIRARECGVGSGTVALVMDGVEQGGFSRADGSGLLMPLVEACADQFPLAPFEDKLAEGLAKRVPPARIATALETRLDAFRFVRNLLVPRFAEVDQGLLAVLGEGVSQGTPREDVARYVSEFSDQPAAPFLTGAHMVCLLGQSGFDYGLTRALLDAAFAEGGPAPRWRYFIRLVLVGRQRGLTDAEIASAARRVLMDGGSLNDVSSRLGFTARSLTGRPDSN